MTPEQRADIPYGIGSYLRTAIDPEYYRKCTVGGGGPGWESVPEAGCPIRWETVRYERSAPLTIDQAAAELGWEILRNSDLRDITHTLSRVAESSTTLRRQLTMYRATDAPRIAWRADIATSA